MTHTDTDCSSIAAERRTLVMLPTSPGNDVARQTNGPGASDGRRARHLPRIDWKRSIDIAVALAVLVFFLPVLFLIAICLLVQDGRPLIFTQQRIGKGGRAFPCFKFRSMPKHSDALLRALLDASPARRDEWEATRKLENDPRIHRVGNILRRSSLDELPQLVNVLRGEMSIVGPRPIVQQEVSKYGSTFAAYQSVRPGLTGLWQVSGRNRLSYERRVELDAEYVETLSLRRDLSIMLSTVRIVLFARGDF